MSGFVSRPKHLEELQDCYTYSCGKHEMFECGGIRNEGFSKNAGVFGCATVGVGAHGHGV